MIVRKLLLALALCSAPAVFGGNTVDLQGLVFNVDTVRHFTIGPGVTQTALRFSSGSRAFNAFVTTLNTSETDAVVPQVVIGRDSCNTAETVSSMAKRHTTDDNQILAGINGDFFITSGFTANHPLGNAILGYPNTTCIIDGKLAAPDIIDKVSRENCLIMGSDGWWIDATDLKYRLLNNTGDVIVDATAINYPRGDGDLIVYNSFAGGYTSTAAGGREILLTMVPGAEWRINGSVKFEVASEWWTRGCMAIPEDGIVISCGKDYHNDFIDALKPGDIVKLKVVCSLPAFDKLKPDIKNVIGGDVRILNCGVTVTEAIRFINTPTSLYSRSLVGYSEDRSKMVMCSVDAGNVNSSGVSYFEAADLMRFLGCYDALDLDGGGSTEMYTPAMGVFNHLRDGAERPVGNALFFSLKAPKDDVVTSVRFADPRITLPLFGLYRPLIYGYNQYGQLVDTDFKGFTLEAPEALGEVTEDAHGVFAAQAGTYPLTVRFGNSSDVIVVKVDGSATATPVCSNIIVDQYHPWTVQLQATVGNTAMEVAPQAFAWTSGDESIVTVDAQGVLHAVADGSATVTGVNSTGSVSVNVKVQLAPAAKAPVDCSDFDPASWSFSKSGVSSVAIKQCGDEGFTVDAAVTGGRSPYFKVNKKMDVWGIPDAIELEVEPHAITLTNFLLNVKAACAARAVNVTLDIPAANTRSVITVPVSSFAEPDEAGTYPLTFNSLAFYTSDTGDVSVDVHGLRAVYSSFTGGVADIAVGDDADVLVPVVTDSQIVIPFTADALELFDLTGRLIVSVSHASALARPQTGVYILRASIRTSVSTARIRL